MKRLLLLFVLALFLVGCEAEETQPVPKYVLTYAENQPEGYSTVLGAEHFADLEASHRND